MTSDLIVGGAVLFTTALIVAWLTRPDLRTFVERPKFMLQARLDAIRRNHIAKTREGR